MRVMQSMELNDEDKIDALMPIPMPDKPDFPYGLKICLTEKELEKLKVDPSDAEIGGTFHLCAMARVTSVSMTKEDGRDCCRIECQIEEMTVESEDHENNE